MSRTRTTPAHARSQPWDARAYDRAFSYVSTLAASLLDSMKARL